MSDESPLIKALGSKNKGAIHGPFKMPEPPRILDLQASELPDPKIGDEVSVCVTGRVKSLHDDGRVVVEIETVTQDQGEPDEPQTKDEAEKIVYARSDTSPVPS